MRCDADGDQKIAGRMAGRGLALPLEPDLLAGRDADRNPNVEFFPGGQADPLFSAVPVSRSRSLSPEWDDEES